MKELWIPIVAIVAPAVVVALIIWARYRLRQDLQHTIRLALEKGHELSPEVIDRLGHPRPTKNKDLRLGVIWMAIAAAVALFGQTVPDDEANTVLLGIASFPFFIGLAYMIIYRFGERD